MVKRLEVMTEVFAYVDPIFALDKKNERLADIIAREGRVNNKYRGIKIKERKEGEYYLFAVATLRYDSSTSIKDVVQLRRAASRFIEEVQSKGYSSA